LITQIIFGEDEISSKISYRHPQPAFLHQCEEEFIFVCLSSLTVWWLFKVRCYIFCLHASLKMTQLCRNE
jgi:hypothetical protein